MGALTAVDGTQRGAQLACRVRRRVARRERVQVAEHDRRRGRLQLADDPEELASLVVPLRWRVRREVRDANVERERGRVRAEHAVEKWLRGRRRRACQRRRAEEREVEAVRAVTLTQPRALCGILTPAPRLHRQLLRRERHLVQRDDRRRARRERAADFVEASGLLCGVDVPCDDGAVDKPAGGSDTAWISAFARVVATSKRIVHEHYETHHCGQQAVETRRTHRRRPVRVALHGCETA